MRVMFIVESWWNGKVATMASQRVRLCRSDGRWSVEQVGPYQEYTVTPCVDETQARREVARLLTFGRNWRRVDTLQSGGQ